MKKRTTAQRRKAARAGWEKRRLKMANKPSEGKFVSLDEMRNGGLPEAAEVWATPKSFHAASKFLKKHEILHEALAPKNVNGSFGLAAEVSQRLKAGIEWALQQGVDPTAAQKEATDLICTTFGRMYANDSQQLACWTQIAEVALQMKEHMND